MPPKAATNGDGKAAKMYSADVVAAVLLATGTTSLTMKHYELMSSIDGVKTASAFQHDFRPILAKAKDLKARMGSGESFEPVQPTTKRDPFAIPSRPTSSSTNNMGKAADAPAGGQKMIPADCVSVLLMALGSTSISKEQLNIMSALDGTRTASSFEHQFRSISAKAKELKKRIDEGEVFTPVAAQKRGMTTPATPKKRKGDDHNDTPSKKLKGTPKLKGKKAQPQAEAPPTPQPADDDDLPADMADFIKTEKQWEEIQFA